MNSQTVWKKLFKTFEVGDFVQVKTGEKGFLRGEIGMILKKWDDHYLIRFFDLPETFNTFSIPYFKLELKTPWNRRFLEPNEG